MNKVVKRIAIIAGVVVFSVVIATGVTFVSAQKANLGASSLLAQNIVALAKNENGGGSDEWTCYARYENCSKNCTSFYFCGSRCPIVKDGTNPSEPGKCNP